MTEELKCGDIKSLVISNKMYITKCFICFFEGKEEKMKTRKVTKNIMCSDGEIRPLETYMCIDCFAKLVIFLEDSGQHVPEIFSKVTEGDLDNLDEIEEWEKENE